MVVAEPEGVAVQAANSLQALLLFQGERVAQLLIPVQVAAEEVDYVFSERKLLQKKRAYHLSNKFLIVS